MKDAEYLLKADYCKSMAEVATTTEQKVAWLELAGKWLALIPEHVTTESARVISIHDAKATGQKAAGSAN